MDDNAFRHHTLYYQSNYHWGFFILSGAIAVSKSRQDHRCLHLYSYNLVIRNYVRVSSYRHSIFLRTFLFDLWLTLRVQGCMAFLAMVSLPSQAVARTTPDSLVQIARQLLGETPIPQTCHTTDMSYCRPVYKRPIPPVHSGHTTYAYMSANLYYTLEPYTLTI